MPTQWQDRKPQIAHLNNSILVENGRAFHASNPLPLLFFALAVLPSLATQRLHIKITFKVFHHYPWPQTPFFSQLLRQRLLEPNGFI